MCPGFEREQFDGLAAGDDISGAPAHVEPSIRGPAFLGGSWHAGPLCRVHCPVGHRVVWVVRICGDLPTRAFRRGPALLEVDAGQSACARLSDRDPGIENLRMALPASLLTIRLVSCRSRRTDTLQAKRSAREQATDGMGSMPLYTDRPNLEGIDRER